jgi:hypothetical protein
MSKEINHLLKNLLEIVRKYLLAKSSGATENFCKWNILVRRLPIFSDNLPEGLRNLLEQLTRGIR